MNKKNISFHLISILAIGVSAKCISLISRMILTRFLGQEAIGIYSLVNPILVLILTLSSFSLPTAVATLISKGEGKAKTIIYSALTIIVLLSLFLMFLLLLLSDLISNEILFNSKTEACIIASLFIIPLTSISAIIKGYFLGSNEIELASYSQVFEEAGRLLFILLCSYLFTNASVEAKASFAVFALGVGEIFQISSMLFFCKRTYKSKLCAFIKTKNIPFQSNELIKISFPLTIAKLIGSLTYCLEPIIFTHLMSNNSFSSSYIAIEYGIINSYVMPLLLIPSFISLSLSNYLLPNIGKCMKEKNYAKARTILLKILIISLTVGIIISCIFMFFGETILNIVYGEEIGLSYLRKITFFFIIYYIETPIITALSVCSLSSKSLFSTIVSSIIRIVSLIIFIPGFHVMGIAISTLLSIYVDVSLNFFFLNAFFKRNNVKLIF